MRTLLSWALALIVIAVLSVSLYETRGTLRLTVTKVNEQATALETLRASQVQMQAGLAALSTKSQVTRKEVSDALAKEPDYRDTAVPASVADGLCKRLSCAK
ncbi:hypothetical protein [Arthrobacter sp. B2a2-09]|uniref:hypothetical protein n=1 Tax=Arthrobacter sp. B2a2-09 TaxID=2952822 RepID=UPI0022CD7406|nr:hypothetical protein [Arthrobacter sp. B2a2-09]